MKKYDVIVIGGGSGGLTAAAGAASFGARTALIDRNALLGGECVFTGCIPSKALIHQANEYCQAKKLAEKQGLSLKLEFDKVKKEVQKAIAAAQKADSDERFKELGTDLYHEQAYFLSPHEIQAGSEVLYGKKIVIATGSSPSVQEIPGLKEAGFETNETIFDLNELPEKLAVIGGGPIGTELGQAFARLGSEVAIIQHGEQLLSKEDHDIQSFLMNVLKDELKILTGSKIAKVRKNGNTKILEIERESEIEELEADCVLLAAGRKPNTSSLKLENCGVKTDEKGYIEVNDHLQTNVKHIYACGDVIGTFQFTHAAGQEGKKVVQNALFGLKSKMDYTAIPWNTYTMPEVFHLGKTEREAAKTMQGVKVYKKRLNETDRFITAGEDGLIKIITDSKNRIIGAHAVGNGAGDWMQPAVQAMGSKISTLSNMVYPYPNRPAAIGQTADLFWREKLFTGPVKKLAGAYIKYIR